MFKVYGVTNTNRDAKCISMHTRNDATSMIYSALFSLTCEEKMLRALDKSSTTNARNTSNVKRIQ